VKESRENVLGEKGGVVTALDVDDVNGYSIVGGTEG